MTDYTALAESYLDIWNETDAARRRALADDLFAPTCQFTDPLARAEGPAAIEAVIEQAQQQFAGHRLRLGGSVDGHHDQFRFVWELVSDDAAPVVVGFDVLVTGPDGKVEQVLGFLDKVPAS